MKASDHAPQSPAQPPHRPRRSRQVPYSDALVLGMIAAAVVLISTIVFTRAWLSLAAMGLCGIYTVAAFVLVAGVSMLLNRLIRNDGGDEEEQYPVLH
ncbi:hypothetical protein BRM1_09225 [Brevibacterium sp. BRM-1]|uniref:hypothetical protein n=1 Tax=Brevibacterium sp. BRM-1 TaxID=2999062 RepID=UPI002282E2C6|nr:hypothetical protein [Brevibacterium sp. BRM-1]WAL39458.1 hypothetical protein BRM1_09225 [Brevibacterium sp. BRM-1]